MDTEMYPNDGEYFTIHEPAERVQKRLANRGKAKANQDIILDVINRLHERIAAFSHIDTLPDDSLGDMDVFRLHVMANKQTVINLEAELEHWKGVLKSI